jgi:hypothetical protein
VQQYALQRRGPQISTKLGTARSRLREFRQNLSNYFRKSQKTVVEIVPSPFGGSQLECAQLSSAPPVLTFPFQESVADSFSSMMDGATERMFRKNQLSQARPANGSAIFVHAGAGYHSTTNEHIHLGACDRYVDLVDKSDEPTTSSKVKISSWPPVVRRAWECESWKLEARLSTLLRQQSRFWKTRRSQTQDMAATWLLMALLSAMPQLLTTWAGVVLAAPLLVS